MAEGKYGIQLRHVAPVAGLIIYYRKIETADEYNREKGNPHLLRSAISEGGLYLLSIGNGVLLGLAARSLESIFGAMFSR